MPQRLIQTQTQKQTQQQRLSQQQMLQVKLLEMPLTELEQNIDSELRDNPALEQQRDDLDYLDDEGRHEDDSVIDSDADASPEEKSEREERDEAIDEALKNLGGDDDDIAATVPGSSSRNADEDYEETVWGDSTSFYDVLKEQMGEMELTPQQHDIMEYLIGSLDSDGLLRKSLDSIADELAIYHNIDVPVEEIEDVLKKLQTFDPAGIGARSLQECLLLQINRRPAGRLRDLMADVVKHHFDEFTKKHWNKIAQSLQLTKEQADTVHAELLKLNPKPGAALGETQGRSLQQITPDFIVDTDDDGNVSFTINNGHIPDLKISPAFSETVNTYRTNSQNMNRAQKEGLLYAKEKVEKAKGYIEAIKQRHHTLYVTMKAIIDWQKKYFQTGDESDLKPMRLVDLEQKTGLDKSTISRVSNMKYAQTRWGTFPLRYFFSDEYVTEDGTTMSTRKMKVALKDIIDHEDKSKPLSDDALAAEMKRQGFPVARRTIAKYREQLGLPVARLRKS